MPVALFDLDGTLTDPKVGITRSMQYALRCFGTHVEDLDALTSYIGPPLQDSFELLAGLSRAEALDAVTAYREYFTDTGIFENRLYGGVASMLADLVELGWRLAVATSKPRQFAARILEHFGVDQWFDVLAGAELDGSRRRKNDVIAHALELLDARPRPGILMVGDREHDIIGARTVGISAVGVTWGYGTVEELVSAGPDMLVENVPDLTHALGDLREVLPSVSRAS